MCPCEMERIRRVIARAKAFDGTGPWGYPHSPEPHQVAQRLHNIKVLEDFLAAQSAKETHP